MVSLKGYLILWTIPFKNDEEQSFVPGHGV